jgi:hypothetical protein
MKPDDLSERLLDLAARIGKVVDALPETRCWIRLIIKAELLPESRMNPILNETDEMCKVIGQSVTTASKNEQSNS